MAAERAEEGGKAPSNVYACTALRLSLYPSASRGFLPVTLLICRQRKVLMSTRSRSTTCPQSVRFCADAKAVFGAWLEVNLKDGGWCAGHVVGHTVDFAKRNQVVVTGHQILFIDGQKLTVNLDFLEWRALDGPPNESEEEGSEDEDLETVTQPAANTIVAHGDQLAPAASSFAVI